MKLKLLGAAVALTLAGLASSASAAIALGDTLQFTYYFPDLSSPNVGPDNVTYTGPGTSWSYFGIGTATVLDANTISLDNACGQGCSWTPGAFNGVKIEDLTNAGAFAGWGVLPGNTQGVTSFSNTDAMYVNWAGQDANGNVTLGGAVPEPTTWAMMMVGVFGLGAALRRRREHMAVAAAA